MEKAYKTMTEAGTGNIVTGIIIIAIGLAAGILTLVQGGRLLRNRKNLTF